MAPDAKLKATARLIEQSLRKTRTAFPVPTAGSVCFAVGGIVICRTICWGSRRAIRIIAIHQAI